MKHAHNTPNARNMYVMFKTPDTGCVMGADVFVDEQPFDAEEGASVGTSEGGQL